MRMENKKKVEIPPKSPTWLTLYQKNYCFILGISNLAPNVKLAVFFARSEGSAREPRKADRA